MEIDGDDGNASTSEKRNISRGCPQGSILSPLLFIIYTADLVAKITYCYTHLYADDTQLYYSFNPQDTDTAVININADLQAIDRWARENCLVLNPLKSKFMILGTKQQCSATVQQNPKISIGSDLIERVTKARNLGLIMDAELRFVEHVDAKIRNAFYRLKVLYNIRPFLKERTRIMLTESLVLSLLNFGDVVYGPRLFGKTEKAIQRVQNACARFCFDIPRRAHVTPYLNEKGRLKMKDQDNFTCPALSKKWYT